MLEISTKYTRIFSREDFFRTSMRDCMSWINLYQLGGKSHNSIGTHALVGKFSFGWYGYNYNGLAGSCNPFCDGREGERRDQPSVQTLCLGWATEMHSLAWFWDLDICQGLCESQERRSSRSVPHWHKEAFLWTTGLLQPGTRTGDVGLQKLGWHTHSEHTHTQTHRVHCCC